MFGIVANVKSEKVLRLGAKVWICRCNGDAEHPFVTGLSRGGRTVEKYTHYRKLENYRAKWVPEHMRFPEGEVCWFWPEKERAEEVARQLNIMWQGIRIYSADGSALLHDGEPVSAAFKRLDQHV